MSNEIKVGDEVIHDTRRYIVVAISNYYYFCLRIDGKFLGQYFESVLKKTGKHFDQIMNVLEWENNMEELLRNLESLRINVDVACQYCDPTGVLRDKYERANEMLDDCIEYVKEFFNKLHNE